MLRIVFMGTPEFSVPSLEALSRWHSMIAVYTQPDRPAGRGQELQFSAVKKKANELGIPVFQPAKLTLPGEKEKLRSLAPDLIVVVAYGQILKREVLDLPRLGCVNVHSSLLPRWRGAAPIHWALLAGDSESGVTVMRMAEKLDAGDILLQEKTPIQPEETAESLHDRLAVMGAELIVEAASGLEAGRLQAIPQDESQVTFAPKLGKEMERLDPTASAQEVSRRVRALNPWPGTSVWVLDNGKSQRLKIKSVNVREEITGHEGEIFEKAGMVLLGLRQGSVEMQRMQWDGKSETGPSEFLNGLHGRGKTLPLRISSRPS